MSKRWQCEVHNLSYFHKIMCSEVTNRLTGTVSFVCACVCMTHPHKVHFLTVFHKAPEFGSHLFPHAAEVPEHAELLKRLVDLRERDRVKQGSDLRSF